MARWTNEWDDGSIAVTYDGKGKGDIAFSATPNEGVDKEMEVTLVDEKRRTSFTFIVTQEGRREVLEDADGEVWETLKVR